MDSRLRFIGSTGKFSVDNPENISYLYFPLASEAGLKSSVTPNLGGDAKTDQEHFLLEPVSAENLHSNRGVRNFWCVNGSEDIFSLCGASAEQEASRFTPNQDESSVECDFMSHKLLRKSEKLGISSSVTTFIPVGDNVEVNIIELANTSGEAQDFTLYSAIPLYGRSADNIRDHRNVTSMLHRIKVTDSGIEVCPTMSFDEKGHRRNSTVYYVCGFGADGKNPECFYPTIDSFIGEGGTYLHPRAVYESRDGVPAGTFIAGREAMGAFRFAKVSVASGETVKFIVLAGIGQSGSDISAVTEKYNSVEKAEKVLADTVSYWHSEASIKFSTGNKDFDRFMDWVGFQPFLRRLFGCSFLPHHDYGRGGRGWRDLWQDCLSLLLMTPDDVGRMIVQNFGGVRVDGTNATIIGDGDGNFIADRNGIARVWMDHALWPLMTTNTYIQQTGDISILLREAPYFKDSLSKRGTAVDEYWTEEYGNKQRTESGCIYEGTILEHILVEQLAAFYEVGAHNIMLLRGADWNDALDMASHNGESVAFTYAYAGNLKTLSGLIRRLISETGIKQIEVFAELSYLLRGEMSEYDSIKEKKHTLWLFNYDTCHSISGDRIYLDLEAAAKRLDEKYEWMVSFLRKQEWIEGRDGDGWYNSYYDDHSERVEGYFGDNVRMMLTGQVFAIMSSIASEEQVKTIVRTADKYLYRKDIGGYRLNTDFKELKFDMGRMFGFAYGEKENGAVFSHMTVMFANALYSRGFAREGWKALGSLADTSLDFETSRIYPGIPEYFRTDGRGMYHYLTGSASWYLMTMVTEVFGIHGDMGNLSISPKLVKEQFDSEGKASISLPFASRRFTVTYVNSGHKDFGEYRETGAELDGRPLSFDGSLVIGRDVLSSLSEGEHTITVHLG